MPGIYREPAEIPPEPPPSVPPFVRAARRRRLRLAALGVFCVAGAAVLLWAVSRRHDERLHAEVVVRVQRARRCLIDQPLATGEPVELRFRSRQLAAINANDTGKDRSQLVPWTCATRLRELIAVQRMADEHEPTSSYALLADALEQSDTLTVDLSLLLRDVFSAFDRTQREPLGAAPMARALRVDALSDDARISDEADAAPGRTERNPGPTRAAAFSNAVCSFIATNDHVLCRTLDQHEYSEESLVGTSEVEDTVLLVGADDHHMLRRASDSYTSRQAVLDGHGQVALDGMFVLGAVARSDGSVAALGYDAYDNRAADERIAVRRANGSVQTRPLPLPATSRRYAGAQLLWDEVFLRAVATDDREEILVASVDDLLRGVPAYRTTALTTDPGDRLRGCRSAHARVVQSSDQLAFRHDDGTYAVVSTTGEGTLGCHGDVATLIGRGHIDMLLQHTRCAAAGCAPRVDIAEADFDRNGSAPLPLALGQVQAVDVGEKLLVVWRPQGTAGLRLRLAALADVGAAPDHVVFDDYVVGEDVVAASTLHWFQLLATEGDAALVLGTNRGVYVLRVDSDGAVRPWPVALTR